MASVKTTAIIVLILAIIGAIWFGSRLISSVQMTGEAKEDLNRATNNLVDICIGEPTSACDQELRGKVADSCNLAGGDLDACKDSRVDDYYKRRSGANTGPITDSTNLEQSGVKFFDFALDKTEIKVGESTNLRFAVQNFQPESVKNAQAQFEITPSDPFGYLAIDRPSIDLPEIKSGARSDPMTVAITATSAPAKEAVYTL